MDAKDLRTQPTLCGDRYNESSKYTQGGESLQCDRNKTYQVGGSNSLSKVDIPSSRPCAVIGPDRVVAPPSDAYLQKPAEPWPCSNDTYQRPPEYPHKLPSYLNQTQNISPRQTFQENMQRIMVPPTYNSSKLSDDSNYAQISDRNSAQSKNIKLNVPSEAKYCDVPYTVNTNGNEQKNVQNPELCVSSGNTAHPRTVPHGWPTTGVNLRPRTYAAPDLYPYQEYPSCAGPRPVGTRAHRTGPEESAYIYPDPYYQDGNVRFKPYPSVKNRYPPRYEYIANYTNSFHPPPPFTPHRYELQKSVPPHFQPYPPVKYVDNRVVDSVMDGYQRNQPANFGMPYRNPVIHANYATAHGSCPQNKMHLYPHDGSVKPIHPNKLTYDHSNKSFIEYENSRQKMYPSSDSYFVNEMGRIHSMKSQVIMPNYPNMNMHQVPSNPYYAKDNCQIKHYDYMSHFKNMDPNLNVHNLMSRHPVFSPNTLPISPTDSSTSNDTNLTVGNSQDDCGYISQSSSASIRSMDSGISRGLNEYYRSYYDPRSMHFAKSASMLGKIDTGSSNASKDKKQINVRQFLQMWSEGDDETEEGNSKDIVNKTVQNENNNLIKTQDVHNQEQLYVLGLVNVPCEELGKYEHIQKVSKLPENIKGYTNIELLNQFEEVTKSSNINSFKSSTPQDGFQIPVNGVAKQPTHFLPRPVSPLDVEAKISQSIIHKEVGCNFEIKPCSPKMLNVDIAAPVQNILAERTIEKVTNTVMLKSPNLRGVADNVNYNIMQRPDSRLNTENSRNSSCKMINIPFVNSNSDDTMKNSYSFQDLESNSGLCLASLPRLDNDIELNFPEVNQQFINANRVDPSIRTIPKDLPLLDDGTTQDKNNELKELGQEIKSSESSKESEKEFTKLSKYRKNKTNYISETEKPAVVSKEDQVHHNLRAVRTDSVIIKNPENTKNCENDSDISTSLLNKSDHTMQQAPINLTAAIEISNKYDKVCNVTNDENETNEASLDVAIDFSLNRNDSSNAFLVPVDPDSEISEEVLLNSSVPKIQSSENAHDISKLPKDHINDKCTNNCGTTVQEFHGKEENINVEFDPTDTDDNKERFDIVKIGEEIIEIESAQFARNNKDLINLYTEETEVGMKINDKLSHTDNKQENKITVGEIDNINDIPKNDFEAHSNLAYENKNEGDIMSDSEKSVSSCIENSNESQKNTTHNFVVKNNNNSVVKTNVGNTLENIQADQKQIMPSANLKHQLSELKKSCEQNTGNYTTKGDTENGDNEVKAIPDIDAVVKFVEDTKEQPLTYDKLEDDNCVELEMKFDDNKIFPISEFSTEEGIVSQKNEIGTCGSEPNRTKGNEISTCVNEDNATNEIENGKHWKSSQHQQYPTNSIRNQQNDNNLNKHNKNVYQTHTSAISDLPIEIHECKTDKSNSSCQMQFDTLKDIEIDKSDMTINLTSSTFLDLKVDTECSASEILLRTPENMAHHALQSKMDDFTPILECTDPSKTNVSSKLHFDYETNITHTCCMDNFVKEKNYEDAGHSQSWRKGLFSPFIQNLIVHREGFITNGISCSNTLFNENTIAANPLLIGCSPKVTVVQESLKNDVIQIVTNIENNSNRENDKDIELKVKENLFEFKKELSANSPEENITALNCDDSVKVGQKFPFCVSAISPMNIEEIKSQTNVINSSCLFEDSYEVENNITTVLPCNTITIPSIDDAMDAKENWENSVETTNTKVIRLPLVTDLISAITSNENTSLTTENTCKHSLKINYTEIVEPQVDNTTIKINDNDEYKTDIENTNQTIVNSLHNNEEINSTTTDKNITHDAVNSRVKLNSTSYTLERPSEMTNVEFTELGTHTEYNKLIKAQKHSTNRSIIEDAAESPDKNIVLSIDNNEMNHSIENKDCEFENSLEISNIDDEFSLKGHMFPSIPDNKKIEDHTSVQNTLQVHLVGRYKTDFERTVCHSDRLSPINKNEIPDFKTNKQNNLSNCVDSLQANNMDVMESPFDTSTISILENNEKTNAFDENKTLSFHSCEESNKNTNVEDLRTNTKSLLDTDADIECSRIIPPVDAIDSSEFQLHRPEERDSESLVNINSVTQDQSVLSGEDKSFCKIKLKRSLSDSALNHNVNLKQANEENFQLVWPYKRRKLNIESFEEESISQNITNMMQNNRRNSISSFYPEENVSFCILIDNTCIIAEEETEDQNICFTELSEDCRAKIQDETPCENDNLENLSTVATNSLGIDACEYSDAFSFNCGDKTLEDSWVEDIACVETVISDDIGEDIVISGPSSPKVDNLSDSDESSFFNCSEHTDKVKYIYGEKMCSDDAHYVDTLFNTPQMNVTKTLINREAHVEECDTIDDKLYYDRDSLEKILSESNGTEPSFTSEYLKSIAPADVSYKPANDKENMITEKLPLINYDIIGNICPRGSIEINEITPKNKQPKLYDETQDDTVHSCESSVDNVFSYKLGLKDGDKNHGTSSFPEVSSTTSEEKNSTILLKITNYNGSRTSQINSANSVKDRPSCKFTEEKDYLDSQSGNSTKRPLLTKAAKKYIPPLKESIGDLKVKISLPQHSLLKLKQLKKSKDGLKKESLSRIPIKPKPKFEDVLKSIDDIQFQKHKEKTKKSKKSIPKVVIKKNENGSHYASTSSKEEYNPDLTGRKWQPWVFLEKDSFIDKMAIKHMSKAIFSHRKNTYVLAEKFKKYKSIHNAKFVISQPKSENSLTGLKYTIRLKHIY